MFSFFIAFNKAKVGLQLWELNSGLLIQHKHKQFYILLKAGVDSAAQDSYCLFSRYQLEV